MSATTAWLDGSEADPAVVGGKAHALNRLVRLGVRVPPSGVVSTRGYRRFVSHARLAPFLTELRRATPPGQHELEDATRRVDDAFLEAPMPPELADEIRRLAGAVRGSGALAVRSSATAEDTAATSFAGAYRSFLGVVDDEDLLRSVRLVWASLWHPGPRSYRAHAGVDEDDLAMAVVVMRLVDARRAGVAFTVDPAGPGTELRVEAVDGLADRLVSGAVTPDAYVLPRRVARRPPVDPLIAEVSDTALALERAFGTPQDVEWAHDGTELFVVQTRPITTLLGGIGTARRPDGDGGHTDRVDDRPHDVDHTDHPGDDGFDTAIGPHDTFTTAGIAEAVPGVLPPLQWTTVGPLLENGFRRLFDELGSLPAAADRQPFVARVQGRAVLSLDLMRAAAREVPGGSADEIERQYFGRVISGGRDRRGQDTRATAATRRRGPLRGLRAMATGLREIMARRRFRFEAEISVATIERILSAGLDHDALPWDQLLAYRQRVLDVADRAVAAEVAVAAAAASAYRGVEQFLETHVGDEAAGLAQGLTTGGVDPCGAQIALRTCDIAEHALARPELSSALDGLDGDEAAARARLAAIPEGRDLLAQIDRELRRAGSARVFAGETWEESADLAWRLFVQAMQVAHHGRPAMADVTGREELLRRTEARLASSWTWRMQRLLTGQVVDLRRRLLRRLVGDAVEFLHLREKAKSAVLALGGEVRRIHLAIGRQLRRRGALDDPRDVDLLGADELHAAAQHAGPSAWELQRRKAVVRSLGDAAPVPQVFTGDPRRSVGDRPPDEGDALSGAPASTGRYEGTARIVTSAAAAIEPGDILVARTTDPAWTPLFLTAGAIVVEEGGPLSHAAIIARELGLPAVVNVPGLLERLRGLDGVRLRVDGGAGTVEILAPTRDGERDEIRAAA